MSGFLRRLAASSARLNQAPASKAEWVATAVERQITEDGLAPGTLVGTREQLRDAFDVAPSTIAEAIRLLAARGLVSTRTGPGGGVFVTQPDPMVRLSRTMLAVSDGSSEVADALEVRDQLEPAVIIGAARHRADADLRPLRAAFDRMSAPESLESFFQDNLRFHLAVAELCSNEILKNFYVATVQLITAHRPALRPLPGENQDELLSERIEVHRMILDAIEAGDPEAAQIASDAHFHRGHPATLAGNAAPAPSARPAAANS